MVVGRNPGKQEDDAGAPFVGRSGKFLNEYLQRCGIPRERCFVTNVVKCHTRSNRAPDILEIKTCSRLWLLKELNEIQPAMIFVLGADAYRGVFGYGVSPWLPNTGMVVDLKLGEDKVHVVVLPHPSAVLTYRPSWRERYDMTERRVMAIIHDERLLEIEG
jgi:DNA polymerase